MPQSLANKTAFITGASSGIGLSTARLFAANGARLILAARRIDRLNAERASLNAAADVHTIQLDVTDHAA
ncbi:MAG TPA: SDR family NAD(P)-dependent oxidoreductase, partial [Acidobacteriaceae bacterium]